MIGTPLRSRSLVKTSDNICLHEVAMCVYGEAESGLLFYLYNTAVV